MKKLVATFVLFGILKFMSAQNIKIVQSNINTTKNKTYQKTKIGSDLNNSILNKKVQTINLFPHYPSVILISEKLPLFCELEFQLGKLINKNVKFGVEPKGAIVK